LGGDHSQLRNAMHDDMGMRVWALNVWSVTPERRLRRLFHTLYHLHRVFVIAIPCPFSFSHP